MSPPEDSMPLGEDSDDIFLVCCSICPRICSIGFNILLGFAVFQLVKFLVDLSHSNPHIYVQDFYVPALDKTTAFNTSDTSVYVDLLFARRAAVNRPSYRDFQMALSYGMNSTKVSPVGNSMFHGFSMGRKKRVNVKAETHTIGLPWEEALRVVSNENVVFFAVKLVVDRSDYPVEVVADVMVDASGHMFSKDPIRFYEAY